MTGRKWLAVAFLLLSVALGVGGWAFWPLLFNQPGATGQVQTQVDQLKTQQHINQSLLTIEQNTTKSFTLLSTSVSVSAMSKDKLDRTQVAILRASLDLYKIKLDVAQGELDDLLTSARRNLDGDILEQVTASIQGTQAHLNNLRAAQADLVTVYSQRFETPLDRALKDAYKRVEDALNELNKEQQKDKGKQPKP